MYILVNHEPVEILDLVTHSHWMKANKVLAQSNFPQGTVSTVFLGIDHRFSGDGPPILFETMIFEGPEFGPALDYQERYCTWQEALDGHKRAIEWLKSQAALSFTE